MDSCATLPAKTIVILFMIAVICRETVQLEQPRNENGAHAYMNQGKADTEVPLVRSKRSDPMPVHERFARSYAGENDQVCTGQKTIIENLIKDAKQKDKFLSNYTFANETKFSLSIAWSEESSDVAQVILVVVTEEVFGLMAKPSTVYRSIDNGLSFTLITESFPLGSGEQSLLVRKDNGLQRHPHNLRKVFVIAHGHSNSIMYVSDNGGKDFTRHEIPLYITGALTYHPKADKDSLLLSLDIRNSGLYLSQDSGRDWQMVQDKVRKFKWGTGPDDGDSTIYTLVDPNMVQTIGGGVLSNDFVLMRSEDLGRSWKELLNHVYTFGHEGKFLYASIYKDDKKEERIMKVSTDAGLTWNEVQLESIASDRFYSILDMNEDMIFMHVDAPGDTGHGTLYTSDSTGIIFSDSLDRHLYPNNQDVTDFYRVQSLRGVYLASQMAADDSIHTMITFNRGAEWRPVKRPEGATCKDESKACYLQIHNFYSMVRGIQTQPPLSSPSATGIIIVHGHVADALQTTPPDVYITSDGGYNWIKALDGPHHYQIADQGGLIIAIPVATKTPKLVKFSTDEGRCWHTHQFTNDDVIFTGLLTEPGNKAMHIGIWGFGQNDRKWRVFIINFRDIVKNKCDRNNDYETWSAHSEMHHDKDPKFKGCLLGVKETFQRLKKDSLCFNDRTWNVEKSTTYCECTEEDYECDYGFYRPINQMDCQNNKKFNKYICMHGKEEKLISQGYRKIPGDKCQGGFAPAKDKVVKLPESCDEGRHAFILPIDKEAEAGGSTTDRSTIMVAFIVIIIVLLTAVTIMFFGRKFYLLRKHTVTYRYSMLNQNADEYDYDNDIENALSSHSSLYHDSEEEEIDSTKLAMNGKPRPQPKRKVNNKVKSYHDDSDDDLLE